MKIFMLEIERVVHGSVLVVHRLAENPSSRNFLRQFIFSE
jgi:hypothetical protein